MLALHGTHRVMHDSVCTVRCRHIQGVCVCGMTYSCVRHTASWLGVFRAMPTCSRCLYVWHEVFICVTWRVMKCCVLCDADIFKVLVCVDWRIHMCDIKRHDLVCSVRCWHVQGVCMCGMTYLYVGHDTIHKYLAMSRDSAVFFLTLTYSNFNFCGGMATCTYVCMCAGVHTFHSIFFVSTLMMFVSTLTNITSPIFFISTPTLLARHFCHNSFFHHHFSITFFPVTFPSLCMCMPRHLTHHLLNNSGHAGNFCEQRFSWPTQEGAKMNCEKNTGAGVKSLVRYAERDRRRWPKLPVRQ